MFRAQYVIVLVILAVCCGNLVAQDAKYLAIYDKIQQADSLDEAGKTAAALEKYIEAHSELTQLRREDPSWNRDMVTYRLNYLAEKIASCQTKLKPPEPSTTNTSPAPQKSGTSAATKEPATKAASGRNQPTLKLLEPGNEPRKVLRLQPKPGDTQTVVFTIKISMEASPAPTNAPAGIKFPPITQTAQVTIKDVSANGDIGYESVITEINVPKDSGSALPMFANLSEGFSYLKGLKTSGLVSSRGFTMRTRTQAPKSDGRAAPAVGRLFQSFLTKGIDSSAAPLPEEPVGAGAKWEVKDQDSDGGAETEVYEIVSMEEHRIQAKVTITVSPSKQKNGMISDMAGGGNGEMTLDLARLMPVDGKLAYTMSGAGIEGPQKQNVSLKMRMDLGIETK